MYRVKTFNKISPVGLNRLDPELYAVSDAETAEDAHPGPLRKAAGL